MEGNHIGIMIVGGAVIGSPGNKQNIIPVKNPGRIGEAVMLLPSVCNGIRDLPTVKIL